MRPQEHFEVDDSQPAGHAMYEQLCALASSGALKAEEWSNLAEHLKECSDCRQQLAQYQEIATFGMSLVAPNDVSLDVETQWSPESAVAKLMATLQEQPGSDIELETEKGIATAGAGSRSVFFLDWFRSRNPILAYAATLLIVAGLSVSFYRVGLRDGERHVNVEPISSTESGSTLDALLRQRSELEQRLKSRSSEIDQMSRELVEARTTVASLRAAKVLDDEVINRLTAKSGQQESDGAALRSQLDTVTRDRSALAEKLKQSESVLLVVQHSIDQARDQHSADLAQIAKLEGQITAFKDESHSAAYVEARQLSSGDPDLRALMGARDLFIADVYDIDKTGSPRKPFGRVFYTRGKSLLFYAFDLDRQPGVKAASTFQVWGRRGYGDTHPINMGMMYLDSETSKRWVLKYDDAKALAQVDAVFVTIEPHGGSEVPKGRQLLYASLHTAPNHP